MGVKGGWVDGGKERQAERLRHASALVIHLFCVCACLCGSVRGL